MKSLKKNLLYNIFYQILIIILPLITAPYVSRALGATNLGIYSYTYSVAYYFLLFAMLGISNYGNRTIASVKENKKELNKNFWEIYIIQFTMYIIAILLYICYALLLKNDNDLITWIQIIYVTSGFFDISWLFFGLEKFKITVTRNTIIKLFTVLFVFILVKNQNDLWKYTVIMSFGTLLSQLYLWFQLNGVISFKIPRRLNIRRHIKPILILFIPVIAYSIYKVMDKIMLGNMSTFEQVGFYQSAEKIINIPMGIITAIGTVMMPRMTSIITKGDKNKVNEYIRISIKLVTATGSAISFGIIGTSTILAPIYFGKAFSACSSILIFLSLTIFPLSWANVVRTQVLIPQKKDKVYVSSTMLGAIVNLTINILLIPRFGANGAAIGTIFAELSVMLIQVRFVNKRIPILKYISESIHYIFSGIIMMCIIIVIGNVMGITISTLVLQVIIGSLIYILLILIFIKILKDDIFQFIIKNE